jgi:hypothetical protein
MASIFTLQLTSSQTINIASADSVMAISIQSAPAGGQFTINGNSTFKGIASTNLGLVDGQGATITAPNFATPLDGITISWVSGTVQILLTVI